MFNKKEYAKIYNKQYREKHWLYFKYYGKCWRRDHPNYYKNYYKNNREILEEKRLKKIVEP